MNNNSNFGYTIVAEFVFCFFGGYWLDQKYKTGYVWTFIGIGLGTGLIAYEIWKLLKQKNGE